MPVEQPPGRLAVEGDVDLLLSTLECGEAQIGRAGNDTPAGGTVTWSAAQQPKPQRSCDDAGKQRAAAAPQQPRQGLGQRLVIGENKKKKKNKHHLTPSTS